MKFSIDKKGYSVAEVDAYLKKLADDYTRVVDGLRLRVEELTASVSDKERRLLVYKEKTGTITKAIMNAVSKAEEIKQRAKYKYDQELARLKAFHEKWIAHYDRILKQYPIDEDLVALGEFNREMSKILSGSGEGADEVFSQDLEDAFQSEQKRTGEKRISYITVQTGSVEESDDDEEEYDPVARIQRYLTADKDKHSGRKTNLPPQKTETAATADTLSDYTDRSESGYSFEEAMNPTDDLEQIMKDLGLLLESSDT